MALEDYPLELSISNTEVAKSTLMVRHTEYEIEVDDCGKVYKQLRRYSNFVWLDDELRRRGLERQCALPELPPKKAIGNLDQAFVEERRGLLEDYLRSLLRLPPVIRDDSLWIFLDVDLATAVVPRFLCRLSHVVAAECLFDLERIVSHDSNLFRCCNRVVPANLVAFAREEAMHNEKEEGEGHSAVVSCRRISFLKVIQPLLAHERARHGLMQARIFGALLALLWRAGQDAIADVEAGDAHRSFCRLGGECLRVLIDDSHGSALVLFCEQDQTLSELRCFASPELLELHPICASLLWHGLQTGSVIADLIAPAVRLLPLLGQLLLSNDPCARLLSALCISCVVRHEGALDQDQCAHCLEALAALPQDLDSVEAVATEQAASTALTEAVKAGLGSNSAAANVGRRTTEATDSYSIENGEVSISTSPPGFATHPERQETLVELVKSLCSVRSLPSLLALLGPQESVIIDAVSALIIAVLDHYVLEHFETAGAISAFCGMSEVATRLQYLLLNDTSDHEKGRSCTTDEEPQELQTCNGTVVPEELRRRIARVLLRLEWPSTQKALECHSALYRRGQVLEYKSTTYRGWIPCKVTETRGSTTPDLQHGALEIDVERGHWITDSSRLRIPQGAEDTPAVAPTLLVPFRQRAQILEILNGDSDACQKDAEAQMLKFGDQGARQIQLVQAGDLTGPLCLGEGRFEDFGSNVAIVEDLRETLREDAEASRIAVEAALASLQQHGVKRGVLSTEVVELRRDIGEQSAQEDVVQGLHKAVRQCEELLATATASVESLIVRLRQHDMLVSETGDRAKYDEQRHVELTRKAEDFAEVWRGAPAQLERTWPRLEHCEEQAATLREEGAKFVLKIERAARRVSAIQAARTEAAAALTSIAAVRSELPGLRQELNSELILTDSELDRLRKLNDLLEPPSPSRLGHANGIGDVDCEGGWIDVPSWDELPAEKEYRNSPHFRSFLKLCDERDRLWEAENSWLKSQNEKALSARQQLEPEQKSQELKEKDNVIMTQALRKEIERLDDPAGHAARHDDARLTAAEAFQASEAALVAAAQAVEGQQLTAAKLEAARLELGGCEEALGRARERATDEQARFLSINGNLETRVADIELRMRTLLHECTQVELERHRLAFLHGRVAETLEEEDRSRQALRADARLLVKQLSELDAQLAAADEVLAADTMVQPAGL